MFGWTRGGTADLWGLRARACRRRGRDLISSRRREDSPPSILSQTMRDPIACLARPRPTRLAQAEVCQPRLSKKGAVFVPRGALKTKARCRTRRAINKRPFFDTMGA